MTELDDEETFGAVIPEKVDDNLMERIEACYDELMSFHQALFEAEAETAGEHAAGVLLNLASGDTVGPVLLGRVMQVATPQELGEMVNAIVDAVENPDNRLLCHRPRVAP